MEKSRVASGEKEKSVASGEDEEVRERTEGGGKVGEKEGKWMWGRSHVERKRRVERKRNVRKWVRRKGQAKR